MRLATVDLGVLAANVKRVRELAGATHLTAVVKANAYGHGSLEVAKAFIDGGADQLGVFDLAEALALRAGGIQAPILAWMLDDEELLPAALKADIRLGVSSVRSLEAVIRAAGPGAAGSGSPARVHLKVDTGLSRGGVDVTEWQACFALAAEAEQAGTIHVEGLFTHLANTSRDENKQQANRFQEAHALANAAGLTPELVHIAASEAALAQGDVIPTEVIRVGIALYGLSPFGVDHPPTELGLTPAMTLTSRIASIRHVPAGTGASYGFDWRATADAKLALVPVGYADGLPRAASGKAEVMINGKRCPVAGRIAMDQIVVDVTATAAAVGDSVTIWGTGAAGEPTVDQWAAWAGTIGYELVTKIGRRVTFDYVGTA